MKKVAKLSCSFQQFSVIISTFENTHLMDGNLIQFHQSLGLRHSLLNEHRIDVLHIGKAYKLVDGGVIADVSFEVRIGVAPLFGRHAEHRYIQHVRFICVDNACLSLCYLSGNEIVLDGICVDSVIYFGQFAFGRPAYKTLFFLL